MGDPWGPLQPLGRLENNHYSGVLGALGSWVHGSMGFPQEYFGDPWGPLEPLGRLKNNHNSGVLGSMDPWVSPQGYLGDHLGPLGALRLDSKKKSGFILVILGQELEFLP